jgi:hypothetical protein
VARRIFDAHFLTPAELKAQDAKGLSPGFSNTVASGDDE